MGIKLTRTSSPNSCFNRSNISRDFDILRLSIITVALLARSSRVVSKPIPDVEPVITYVLPSKEFMLTGVQPSCLTLFAVNLLSFLNVSLSSRLSVLMMKSNLPLALLIAFGVVNRKTSFQYVAESVI